MSEVGDDTPPSLAGWWYNAPQGRWELCSKGGYVVAHIDDEVWLTFRDDPLARWYAERRFGSLPDLGLSGNS